MDKDMLALEVFKVNQDHDLQHRIFGNNRDKINKCSLSNDRTLIMIQDKQYLKYLPKFVILDLV